MAVAVSLTVPAAASTTTAATTATATTLTSGRASSSYDSWVTFTAQVTAGSGTPAGSVTFADVSNGSILATRQLSNGKASFSTAALAPGTRRIVAYYGGSSSFSASTSAVRSISVAAAGADAVGYQIDAQHDGDQPRGSLRARSLTRKWHLNLTSYASYPVIAGGRVFFTEGNGGGASIWLRALNASTGHKEWSTYLGDTPNYGTVAYDGQEVFALMPDGVLTAYTASSGHRLWRVQLPYQSTFNAPPTAYDGVVYVSGEGVGGDVYAVSEADGRVEWYQPVQGGDYCSPAVDDSGVYVSYQMQEDYRFGLDGQPVWYHGNGGSGGGGSIPVLHGGSVYVRGDPQTDLAIILSKTSGKQTGTFTATYEPAFSGTSMYTVRNGNLVASGVSGSPHRWTFANRHLDTAPVISNGVVYALSTSGRVYAVSTASGAQVWSGYAGSRTNGPVMAGIAVGGGLLVVPAGWGLAAFGD